MTELKKNNKQFLKAIAYISAIFAGLVCLLVIANYFQISRIDPVNTQVINELVDRLNQSPNDDALRNQIRELDLLARKAYFTNQWQVKTGGYLILMALAIFVIAYQILEANVKKQVLPNPDQPTDILGIQKNARVGIAILGGGLVVTAMLITFLTYNKLGEELGVARAAETEKINQETEETSIDVAAKLEPAPSILESTNIPEETEITEEVMPQEKEVPEAEVKIEKNTPVVPATPEPEKAFPGIAELKRNFPAFRGYNSNGVVYQDNVPQTWNGINNENILWKAPIPVEGYNSPIVWEGKVFLSGANETAREVFCYDGLTGKLLWRTKIENIPGSPAKAPKTTSDTGLAAPTMTTDGKKVYAIFGTGDIVALDFTGKIIWAKNLGVPQNHYGHASSLIMYKDKVLVQYDQKTNSRILALDAQSGAEVWSTPRKVKISWASPVLIEHKGKAQLILAADPSIASYDPETGKENWSLDCIYGEVGPSVCYADGIVYAMNEYASLVAIDVENPSEVIWESDELLSDIPSPIVANGLLIVPASYGTVACFDAKTGEVLWDHDLGNNTYSSPMLVGDKVYLMDVKGSMHIFKLSREFESVANCPLGEDAVSTPAFADGRIYIRANKNIYCIGK